MIHFLTSSELVILSVTTPFPILLRAFMTHLRSALSRLMIYPKTITMQSILCGMDETHVFICQIHPKPEAG